ncbi:MobV family relaxase [Pseudoalteromonas spongiae]|uniref:MobV family relaxase n=1 Tax=Pseudoalteromonas spongiae TaxID=298657 RepID=UPI000C2D0934|nr:MobV family relaxase [Pseudoalteromonas spongiae]
MDDNNNDKCIFRISKINEQRHLRAALAHNLRLENTPNINTELSHKNMHANGYSTIDECMRRYQSSIKGLKIRKNAVLAHEVLITGSPEHMKKLTKHEHIAYFNAAARWLIQLHGGELSNLLCFSVHYDESTVHAHILLIPKINNKLNSRGIIGGARGRLSELQTEFYERVAKRFGFTRGIKNSRAKHQHYSELKNLRSNLRTTANSLALAKVEHAKIIDELDNSKKVLTHVQNELKQIQRLEYTALKARIAQLEQNISRTYRPR